MRCGITLAYREGVAINLLIPVFEVPPSQLAANLHADAQSTTRAANVNPITEPARKNPLAEARTSKGEQVAKLSMPASLLLRRLAPVNAIPVEPAAWTLDPQPSAEGTYDKPERPYIEHRIPTPPQTVADAFNPARPIADLENRLLDLFV